MSSNPKEIAPKVFCLFHEKVDCICIEPVIDKVKLREQLEHRIRLGGMQLKYKWAKDPQSTKVEIDRYRDRLEKMQ